MVYLKEKSTFISTCVVVVYYALDVHQQELNVRATDAVIYFLYLFHMDKG